MNTAKNLLNIAPRGNKNGVFGCSHIQKKRC